MTRLVDLSMPVHQDMLTFPRVPPPMLMLYESWTDFAERIGAAQYGATSLTASYVVVQNDHVGTHMDAPIHCWEPGVTLERVDISRMIGEAVCLDMFKGDVDYGYTAADLEAAGGDVVQPGDIVLIYSGYRDYSETERIKQTYLAVDGAEWLVERGVHSVGCEPAGIEHVPEGLWKYHWYDKDTPNLPSWPAHQVLLSNDVYIIEGLTNSVWLATNAPASPHIVPAMTKPVSL